jgi:hypothetical protein
MTVIQMKNVGIITKTKYKWETQVEKSDQILAECKDET